MSGIDKSGAQRASHQSAGAIGDSPHRSSARIRRGPIGALKLATLVGLIVVTQPFSASGEWGVDAASHPVLVSVATLRALPASGAAWNGVKRVADESVGSVILSDQDSNADIRILAKALVFARLGDEIYRQSVIANLKLAVGSEAGGRTLALGRNLPGIVIAADLVGLSAADPTFDRDRFRPWLQSLLTKPLDGRTLTSTHEERPNNWGTHAGAARMAIAAYLDDTAEMARAATVFRGYLGSRSSYAGFKYGELSWQCDPAKPVGINPTGCTKSGILIDGAIPDDMRRGGTFRWPPIETGYPWEALQGALLQAELLRSAGYDAWGWENRALLRAARFLYDRAGWAAVGDDEWQTWLLDARYGTSYRVDSPVRYGKNFGFTDWIFGPSIGSVAPPPPAPPPPAPEPTPAPAPGVASVGAKAPAQRLVTTRSVSTTSVPMRVSWALTGNAVDLKRFELQVSTDGGSYRALSLAFPTRTSALVSVAPGHRQRFRVRAFDRQGRASAWAAGPTLRTTRLSESSSPTRFAGTWVRAGSSAYIGSIARASRARGATTTLTFSGTSVAWVGPVGPTRGRASVYLDGALVKTIDLYSSTFQARRVLYAATPAAGTHKLTIRVAGTTGRPWVAVDAYFVLTPS